MVVAKKSIFPQNTILAILSILFCPISQVPPIRSGAFLAILDVKIIYIKK